MAPERSYFKYVVFSVSGVCPERIAQRSLKRPRGILRFLFEADSLEDWRLDLEFPFSRSTQLTKNGHLV